jgi:hypothetical protein
MFTRVIDGHLHDRAGTTNTTADAARVRDRRAAVRAAKCCACPIASNHPGDHCCIGLKPRLHSAMLKLECHCLPTAASSERSGEHATLRAQTNETEDPDELQD